MKTMRAKVESMQSLLDKIDNYYEKHLKSNDVTNIAQIVAKMERTLEIKANTLDVKKLLPMIYENKEKVSKLQNEYDDTVVA